MNDTYLTRKTDPKYDDDLVNKRYVDNLFFFHKFEITFDVSNVSVGNFVFGQTANNVPDIEGMRAIGTINSSSDRNSDRNFLLETNFRNNKIYGIMYFGYRATGVTSITAMGYIVYINSNFIDSDTLV